MYIKYIKFGNQEFNFRKGLNVINISNGYEFDAIAIFLSNIALNISKNSIIQDYTDIYRCIDSPFKMKISDNNCDYSLDCFYKSQHFEIRKMKNQEDYKNLIKNINYPIMAYFKSGLRLNISVCDAYIDYIKQRRSPDCFYSDCFSNNRFIWEQRILSSLFIKNKINPTEYTDFHCNQLTKIINDLISINNYSNFSFSNINNYFVCYNNCCPTNISIRDYDIGNLIGITMRLYTQFLLRHEDGFIGLPDQEEGVVISDLEFGERPSYSDKKWKYYEILTKNFKNLQFIMI